MGQMIIALISLLAAGSCAFAQPSPPATKGGSGDAPLSKDDQAAQHHDREFAQHP